MHIVINISEEYFNILKDIPDDQCTTDMLIIKNGTLLPKGHGDLIDRGMLPTDYITDDDISDASVIVKADKEDRGMTNEEAIARIMNHKIVHKMNEPEAIYISKALDMAIEELKQEPCKDAVSRQSINKLQKYEYRCGDATIICVSLTSINKLPPVKLDERTWVPVIDDLLKEKQTQESETKQKRLLLDKMSTMSLAVISTAYLYATNYTMYGVNITEVWKTAKENERALEIAYKKGYHDALQRVEESKV